MKKIILAAFIFLQSLAFSHVPAFATSDELVKVEINKGKVVHLPRPAASIVVADPLTADVQVVSPKTLFVYGKKIGETSITAVDDKDMPIIDATIEVSHNLSSLERAIHKAAPKSNIDIKTVDGGLVIGGNASSVQEAENIKNIAAAFVGEKDKIINMMTTGGGDQVMLKVKIVEMSRTDLKTLGINLQSSVTGSGLLSQVISGSINPTALLSRATTADANILTTITSNKMTLNSLIDILETEGLATVLAEPSLTTSTGKPASFLAGGQYPIPVRGEQGTVTVQYQPFGVSLNFTPVVMSNDRMSILVNPEVSTLNFSNPIQVSGFTYPILDTRKAQATVELGSGQSFVLAGLLRNDTDNNVSKLPGVGDIPVLGALFRSQRFQNNQTELVILVTPYIVHPVSDPKKLQTPTDGFKPPSDMERTALGSLYQQQDMPEEAKKLTNQPAIDDSETKPVTLDKAEEKANEKIIDEKLAELAEEKGEEKPTTKKPASKKTGAKTASKNIGSKKLDGKKLNGESGFILEQ